MQVYVNVYYSNKLMKTSDHFFKVSTTGDSQSKPSFILLNQLLKKREKKAKKCLTNVS